MILFIAIGVVLTWSETSQNSTNTLSSSCPNNQYATGATITTLGCNQPNYSQIEGTVSANYSAIQGFPSGCSAGQFVRSITTTLVCGYGFTPTFVSNSNTCTDTTGGGLAYVRMAGFKINFTVPQTGGWIGLITFQIETPSSALNAWAAFQVRFQTGANPACNAGGGGSTTGNIYYVTSPLSTSINMTETISFAWTTGSWTAGQQEWIDLGISTSSTAAWIFSNPQLSLGG